MNQTRCACGRYAVDGEVMCDRCIGALATAAPRVAIPAPPQPDVDRAMVTNRVRVAQVIATPQCREASDRVVRYVWDRGATVVDGRPARRVVELVVTDDGTEVSASVGRCDEVNYGDFTVTDRSKFGRRMIVGTSTAVTVDGFARDVLNGLPQSLSTDRPLADLFA